MLAPEERMILTWIQQYEVISVEQAMQLLHHKPRAVARKIISGLVKQHFISFVNGGTYIGAYRCSVPDQRMIDALWVLIQFGDQVSPYDHQQATYPSQIFFLKDGVGYEIVVLWTGETHLSRLLKVGNDLKYIIVVPNEEMIPKIELPDVPCIFATVRKNEEPVPEVTFYSKEVGDNSET